MRFAFFFFTACSIAVFGCGDAACDTVCDKNAECQPDAPSRDQCVSLCEDLSERDADYADGIDELADCYDGSTCDEIASGACVPDES